MLYLLEGEIDVYLSPDPEGSQEETRHFRQGEACLDSVRGCGTGNGRCSVQGAVPLPKIPSTSRMYLTHRLGY